MSFFKQALNALSKNSERWWNTSLPGHHRAFASSSFSLKGLHLPTILWRKSGNSNVRNVKVIMPVQYDSWTGFPQSLDFSGSQIITESSWIPIYFVNWVPPAASFASDYRPMKLPFDWPVLWHCASAHLNFVLNGETSLLLELGKFQDPTIHRKFTTTECIEARRAVVLEFITEFTTVWAAAPPLSWAGFQRGSTCSGSFDESPGVHFPNRTCTGLMLTMGVT